MSSVRFLIVLSVCVIRTIANLDLLDLEVEHQCIQHCPLQNRTDAGHYDYACDYDCNIDQCARGCKQWKKALKSSCQSICNGPSQRLSPKELYCIMGCNDAITKYFSQLKSKLITPPAPALVADSLNATSLKLEWNFPEAHKRGLTRHVQWKYEELRSTWHYCRNATWEQDDSVVFIENLQPYTKYRFRVALILGHQENSIVSAPSVVISTLPFGLPASPPSIVRAAPIDCTRISVSWEPGPFPNGPLLSYVLQITGSGPDAHSEVKDIPAENTFYMFRNLRQNENYTVSIQSRNGVGAGPSAKVLVSTPSEPLVKDTQQPILILGTHHNVIEQGADIFEEPVRLYGTPRNITGIAIHIAKKLLFVADSGGYVIKMPLTRNGRDNITASYILTPSQISFMPLDMSVDWLNNQLYILGEVKIQLQTRWQIVRCNLDGRGMTVAVGGLTSKPNTIEVDPYNGYLFWVQSYSAGGLYRLDISDISNGIKHEVQPEMILQDSNLGAFTVDHTNFRLLISNQKLNTINTVSLDGKEVMNIRPKVTKARFEKVISLATANKKFYWTNGDDVFYEEYHIYDESYYHNSYPALSARSYKKVIVNLQSSQPIPIPVNPPTNVQSIFGSKIAKTTWQSPHLLGIQGKGAWQNWSYEISVKDMTTKKVAIYKNINTTYYTIENLRENTEYVIKAAAYTTFGKGPWSSEFNGVTLPKNRDPIILWSAAKGLLKSDATGENVETLIHKSHMRNYYFIDIAWYKNQIYLVTNNSYVYLYDLETHRQNRLMDIDSVGSIAVDWLGKKLYWSNLKRQMIIRGNLNGTQQEPLPIFTLAKELNIDSVKAYLYWSTGYAVECAHLNGANRMEYHPVQLFSGKQVMGLTLDMTNKFVYWIVRGADGSNLFRAPMAGYTKSKITVEKISSLQKPNMQGPLCFFHKRLLWLQDDKNAAISDLQGKNIATISGKSMSGLTLVYVVDTSLHFWPNTSGDDVVVIPETIDRNSVQVLGPLNSFNITWDRITNVNYGTVFYEVTVDSASNNGSAVVTTSSSVRYWQNVDPFTELHVAIRAFTYWGTSPQVTSKIYSPSSTPSTPRNLRSYVTFQRKSSEDDRVSVTFRWDPPTHPNGVIKGYKIFCLNVDDEFLDQCPDVIKPPDDLEYEVQDLDKNQIYSFKVQAFTEIGDGDLSVSLLVNCTAESPIPKLLIASEDSIFIRDIDANRNRSLLHDINTPIEIGYFTSEDKLFWINQLEDLMMYDNRTKVKIMDLAQGAHSLSVDWLERSMYYVQSREHYDGSTVFKIDLNHIDRGTVKNQELFSTNSNIIKLEVSPFTRKLYYIENSQLMMSEVDGRGAKLFFDEKNRDLNEDEDYCNCPRNPTIETSFTLDHSNPKSKPSVIFIDALTENVVSSDKNGCFCEVIANRSLVDRTLPLERIKSDFGSLYWTNRQGLLYALKRNEAIIISKEVNVKDIFIFGNHTQPYPPTECLTPLQREDFTVTLKHRTSNSLTLKMPDFDIHPNCSGNSFSMASVEYTIYYSQESDDSSFWINVTTFEKEYTIDSLKPFTKYTFAVTLRNFYTKDDEIELGPAVTYQTAVGAPSEPQNVSVKVLTPTMVQVKWSPPQELNGATVHYEIYWKSGKSMSGVRPDERPKVEQQYSLNSTEYFTTILNNLQPNKEYSIWLKAFSETNESSSDSQRIEITTYREPPDFVLNDRTAYALNLSWVVDEHIRDYSAEFLPSTSNEWIAMKIVEKNLSEIIFRAEGLDPNTEYKFRLVLWYRNYPEEYIRPSKLTFETLGDRPTPPGIPTIQYVKPNIYKVRWDTSRENGAPIELYMLEGLRLPNYRFRRSTNRSAYSELAPSVEEEERIWKSFYNGTNNSWIIDGLSDKYKYAFRVSAYNSYGWSDPSGESTEFDLNEVARMAEKPKTFNLTIIATCIPISIFLSIFFFILCRNCGKPKKVQVVSIPRGPDVELATLRELPRRGIQNTNVLYVSTQSNPEEVTLLPHIRRDQITLTKFLGSGAFGEVFEGKAKGISSVTTETKVAVKALRKGASDQEKTEFLQEAQLMSNFKHEHILQLLGVCLDNDPHFIIMELMQGGDLLTYLRSSRNPTANTPSLKLIELLKMCEDVSKGCRYLEEMHFVHRDLACRNCLVSSVEAEHRIVKIGDFGLARDIYKNDYYRKEGEGLLPVRWMAPESLVDGVFTSQSDVWAFGVLLWEIMTLGQQPYPARNNMEVLHYVRRGGRLGKPMDCPAALHDLMLRCWEFEADKRPTFKYCLEVLANLHFQKLRSPTTAAHEGQYISTVQECFEGISNEAYFQDVRYISGETDDEANKEKTPFLPPNTETTIPKYLELVYEPSETPSLPNDGYEIPNELLNAGMVQINDTLAQDNNNQSATDSSNKTECESVNNSLND